MKRMFGVLLALSLLFTSCAALADYVNVALRSDLNVREGPSYDSKVIGHLLRNDEVDVKSTADGWAEIKYGSKTGYVRSSYLSKTRVSGGNGKVAFPTLRSGSTAASVKTLQRNLNKILDAKIPLTGRFDKATKNAVLEFQEAYGLPQDGVVGPKTWAKIIELR